VPDGSVYGVSIALNANQGSFFGGGHIDLGLVY
jgi:hypothetical protein